MNTAKTLTAKDIAALKKRPIDFSDIPELTDSQAKELYRFTFVALLGEGNPGRTGVNLQFFSVLVIEF